MLRGMSLDLLMRWKCLAEALLMLGHQLQVGLDRGRHSLNFFFFLVFWRWAHQFDETHNRPRLVCTNKFVRDTMEILCKIKYQVWIQLKPAISWQKCFWNWTPFSLLRCHTTRFWSWKRRKWNVMPLINRGVTFFFVALYVPALDLMGCLPSRQKRDAIKV